MFNDRYQFARLRIALAPEGTEGASAASGASGTPSAPSGAQSPSSSTSGASPSAAPSAPSSPGASEAPSTPGSSPEAEAAPGDPFNFGSESGWFGAEEVIPGAEGPDAAAQEAPSVQQVVAPPGAEPAVQQPPAVVEPPAATAPGPQEARPQEAAQQPPLSPGEPGRLAEALQANEAALIESVAQRYALSNEEREALETDVVGTVPRLLAKLHVRVMTNVLNQMAQNIPHMIERQMRVSKANAENADKFYSRWTDIKKDVHGETVMRLGALYRQMNPNASMEQMIEELGPLVMLQAKITPSQKPIVTTNGSVAVAGAPRAPQPSPFVPAGGGVASIPQQAEPNQWSAESFLGPEN